MVLKDIVFIKGVSGLFKLLKVTRGGLLLETIDKEKKKVVKNINFSKATPLDNIAIYTSGEVEAVPLYDVFKKMYKNNEAVTDISSKSSYDDIIAFIKEVLPEYDEDKLHPSQILKIVSWYRIILEYFPEFFEEKEVEEKKVEEKEVEEKEVEEKEVEEKKVEKKAENKSKSKNSIQRTEELKDSIEENSTKKIKASNNKKDTQEKDKGNEKASRATKTKTKPKKTK